jgi:hypothetical protein
MGFRLRIACVKIIQKIHHKITPRLHGAQYHIGVICLAHYRCNFILFDFNEMFPSYFLTLTCGLLLKVSYKNYTL